MSLTCHYLHYLSFNISNIWWEIGSPPTLLQFVLKVYFEYIWSIHGGLILKKSRDRLWTPGYNLFCETKWSISGAQRSRLFCLILSVTTDVTNHQYCDSKTLNISVACTVLIISLRGDYHELVRLIASCSAIAYWLYTSKSNTLEQNKRLLI